MPRGKNYVNNNRGVSLQASNKKKASQMVACMYGAGCTRDDCIYRHPHGKTPKGAAGQGAAEYQSREPCMPFLAGICTFPAAGCRKRHPPRAEAERLIAKYRSTNCRFGDECRTRGCLYLHPAELEESAGGSPALSGGYAASPPGMAAMGMEEPAYIQPLPPPQAALHAGPQAVSPAPTSAWKPSLPGISGQYCTPTTPQRGRSRSRSGSGSSGGSLSATAGAFVPRSAATSAAATPSRGMGDLSASAGEFVPGSGFVPSTKAQSSTVAPADEPSPVDTAPSQGVVVSSPVSDPWAQQKGPTVGGNPWATEGGLSTFGSPGGWK